MGALRQDGLADETVSRNISLTLKYSDPCGGGVKYLHRDPAVVVAMVVSDWAASRDPFPPASRRRRRKGKYQN
jgi:hypothetical protein